MRYTIPVSLFSLCLLLAACGGSAGGGGNATAPISGTVLGVASDQGVAVQVVRRADAPPGQVMARISITSDAGEPEPTAVSGWIGAEYDPPASPTQAQVVTSQAGAWDVSLPLPTPLPADSAVWVRIDRADGSRIEMGRACFALAAQ